MARFQPCLAFEAFHSYLELNFNHPFVRPHDLLQSNYQWGMHPLIRPHPTLFLALLWLAVQLPAIAQEITASAFSVSHISVEDGLSQSTVNTILQDRQGFLWFATSDGLDRYDGIAFTVFKHDQNNSQSLSSNVLAPLALTGQGTIWIGTSTGLCRYDKTTNSFSIVLLHSVSSIPNQAQITKLLTDRDGLLWVGTQNGLMIIQPDSASTFSKNVNQILARIPQGERIYSLYEDRRGVIWMGIGKHLFAFDKGRGTVTNISVPGTPATIESIYEDSFGGLWFGTDDSRLLRYESQWSVYPVRSDNLKTPLGDYVTAIIEDNAGHLWVGTRLAGLLQFNRTTQSWERFVPPIMDQRFEGVTSLFVDHSGLLWVGYDGSGIIKINPNPLKFHHLLLPRTNTMSSGENFLKPVIVDHGGRLWIGTYDQGLTMLDRATNERVHYVHDPNNHSSLSNNSLLSLAEDLSGRIWIGTTTGVDCFDETMKSFRHFSTMFSPSDSVNDGAVWCLAVDSSHTMWAGTSKSLLKFDEEKQEFLRVVSTDSVKDNWVMCMALDVDSSWWIGTAKTGILHLSRTGTELGHLSATVPNTLSFNFVKCLTLQPDGALWIGTVEGLCRFDTRRKSWMTFRVKDGLPDESIYGILAANSTTLWFSTNRGLVRMSCVDPTHPSFRNYTPEDGLQSYEFNTNTYFKTPAGEMLFGGINGLNTFFPDSIIDNPAIPPIVLTGFKKFDQDFFLGQALETMHSISLDYNEPVFSFDFAALEYTNPHRNQYAYMMEGFEKQWIYCGNRREARYTNLSPGTYTFRVKGSNDDGVWNDAGIAVEVTIVPPFWRRLWFLVLSGCGVVVFFGASIRYLSVRKLRREIEFLERQRALDQERQVTRDRIARDLHDEVSSTLSSMSLFVESSQHRLRDAGKDAGLVLDKLHNLARDAEDAMEQAVWSLSSHHDRLGDLIARIRDVASEECFDNNIRCEVIVAPLSEDFLLREQVRKNVYLIFKESLTNTVKHAQSRSVFVTVGIDEAMFRLTVRDDGRGFVPEQPAPKSRGGNGLKNMLSRAHEIDATLSVESQPGKGATVTLAVQIAHMRH